VLRDITRDRRTRIAEDAFSSVTCDAAEDVIKNPAISLSGRARLRAKAVGTVPIRISMISPIPFCQGVKQK